MPSSCHKNSEPPSQLTISFSSVSLLLLQVMYSGKPGTDDIVNEYLLTLEFSDMPYDFETFSTLISDCV